MLSAKKETTGPVVCQGDGQGRAGERKWGIAAFLSETFH